MKQFKISEHFSSDPYGRFKSDNIDSPHKTGEAFREDYLKPLLESLGSDEKLEIILDDGVESYSASFLSEGFGGIVTDGYMTNDELLNKIEITYSDEDFGFFKNKIVEYIVNAKYNSK